jgi:multicomponent Na+:H+ antiporter subunit E
MGDEDASVYERAAEGIATGRPVKETEETTDAAAADETVSTTDASGSTDGDATKHRKMKRKHPGTPANSSLINAFEARAKLPQPRLNLSRWKNVPTKSRDIKDAGDAGDATGDTEEKENDK